MREMSDEWPRGRAKVWIGQGPVMGEKTSITMRRVMRPWLSILLYIVLLEAFLGR
jgi:hypothetical protein